MSKSPSLSISIKDIREFITEIIADYDIKKEIDEISNSIVINQLKLIDESSRYPIKKRRSKYFTWCDCHQLQSYIGINPQQCFNRHHIT
jgi:hypothetical protein